MVIFGTEIITKNESFQNARHEDFDTILFDPPYNGDFYKLIPEKKGKTNSIIIFSSPITVADSIIYGNAAGYSFLYMMTWDCVSSWYTPGRILMRSNLISVFSDNEYNAAAAVIYDGIRRPARMSKNPRGNYQSVKKDYTKMSSVYVKMRSTMEKIHVHEKPIELVRGIIQSVGCSRVLDCFGGSGSCSIAAQLAGAAYIETYESNPETFGIMNQSISDYYAPPRMAGGLF